MPGLVDEAPPDTRDAAPTLGFTVLAQKVDLDVDFGGQKISGRTEITIQPQEQNLKVVRLNCRQCRIKSASIEGRTVTAVAYQDPYQKLRLKGGNTTVHQHELLKSKIEKHTGEKPEPELALTIPSRVHIQELHFDPFSGIPKSAVQYPDSPALALAETPTLQHQDQGPKYTPIKVIIEFEVLNFRDGLHFVGFDESDPRYPHLYTKNSTTPGTACSVFPCVDDPTMRCIWDVSIRCPRTLGDAFRKPGPPTNGLPNGAATVDQANGASVQSQRHDSPFAEYALHLNEEEKTLDLSIVCSGEMTDDIVDPLDETRRTVSFQCTTPVLARHIGFAIGPFEQVDLSDFREVDEDDKLGQTAIKIDGYCLPGRAEELRNTCMPMAKAIDYFTVTYGSFPFPSYKMCFVDDLIQDISDTASLTICSNRLLFPEDIIEPLDQNTRILVHGLASQYVGVNIIPREATDMWTITGISYYMTDMFMKKLAGNNEFRFRQKLASEKVFELDVERFSIHQLGSQLDIDPSEYEFLALKSALVLFILDRRLTKASGSSGVSRIVTKVLLNAKTGDLDNGELTTDAFHRLCEKLGHTKLDSFFKQWVYGAGCPIFVVQQRFNKKKLVVEMIIRQKQTELRRTSKLEPSTFMREVKENMSEAYAAEVPPIFTGPMTIRIHEADGTPYEHIVEIKEAETKFEIPYNTKYKRLKRSKRAKERAMASTGIDGVGDNQDDVLLYCLGDVLQSEDEVKDWRLTDWSKEDEDRMGQESYEWIRMDADFEWIGKIQLTMPVYMYVSQLQQDRDVVAQYESLQYITAQNAHPLMSTILIRTLMDRRYFHGIRTLAAAGLAICAREEMGWIGQYHLEKAFQEFFCIPDSPMPRANDFSDRTSYIVQCAIPRAMARIRDSQGKVPMSVRRFFVDKLKFNDNSNNEFSDCYYVATLMSCLTDAINVTTTAKPVQNYSFNFGDADDEDEEDRVQTENEDEAFQKEAINELERYRRIDEWIASYHNVYTTTALMCMQRLIQAGVLKNKTPEILQYTRLGNAENVRLRAFDSLIALKVAKKPQILRYILHSLCDDTSPYFRERMLRVFGQALGSIALEEEEEVKPQPPPPAVDSGLVLEGAPDPEVRLNDVVRKTPEGAVALLTTVLANNEIFKTALWEAIQSPHLTITEVISLLDIAALLYEPSTALVTTVRLPKYYGVQHLGKGKLRFYQTGRYRTKPVTPIAPEDYNRLTKYGLKYTGPIPKAVLDQQAHARAQEREAAAHKAELARLQTQLAERERMQAQRQQQQQQSAPPTATAMSPPPLPLPTPTGESKGGLKLSLKRKSGIDASSRAGSPKAPKTAAGQTPNGAAPTPKVKRSPSVSSIRASVPPVPATPAPAAAVKKEKKSASAKSRIVRLRTSGVADRVRSILSRPSKPTIALPTPRHGAQTPAAARSKEAESSYFPPQPSPVPASASPGQDFFSASSMSNYNMGGFRSFGGGGGGGGASSSPAPIKTEGETESAGADAGVFSTGAMAQSLGTMSPAVTPGGAAGEKAMGPPRKKLTLKLGTKKG